MKNIGKYKKICFIAVTILLLGFWINGSRSYASDKDVSIEVTYGNQGMIKYEYPVPIVIKVINYGEEFQGAIRVYIPNIKSYSDMDISSFNFVPSIETENQNYMYEKEVQLPQGEQVEVRLDVRLYQSAEKIRVVVIDGDEEITKTDVKMQSYDFYPHMFLGILSNKEIDLTEYNTISVGNDYAVTTKAFLLGVEDINETSYELRSLDAILVNDFSLETLTDKQQQALMKWIEAGGCLVAEESDLINDIRNLLSDENLSPRMIDYLTNNAEISTYLQEQDQEPTLTKVSYGSGEAGVLGYEMNLDDSPRWNYITKQAIAEILLEVMGDNRIENIYMSSSWYGANDYLRLDSDMNSMYFDKATNVTPYIIILIIYIIIVGPGLYLVLKKAKKRMLIWGGIGLTSVVFTLIIFIMGGSTRITAPFINYLRIKTINEDTVEDLTYLSLKAPYNEDYNLYVDKSYSILPIMNDVGYNNGFHHASLDGYAVGIIEGELENIIEMKEFTSFSSEYFQLEKKEELDASSKVEVDVHYYEDKAWGEVTNHLGYDLENAAVVLFEYIIPIGDLKDGETKDLSQCTISSYSSALYFNDGKILTNSDNSQTKYQEQSIDFKQKNEILKFFINGNITEPSTDAYLIGFSTEKNHLDLQLDTGYEAIGQTLITIPTDVTFTKGNMIYDPYVNYKGRNRQGSVGDNNYFMYQDETIIDYSLGESLVDISLEWSAEEVIREDIVRMFSGEVYFFNQKTSKYDKQESYFKTFTSKELEDYLSSKNVITIKYIQSISDTEENENLGSIRLPILKLTGRIQ